MTATSQEDAMKAYADQAAEAAKRAADSFELAMLHAVDPADRRRFAALRDNMLDARDMAMERAGR
jgi:hypothetical protein